MRHVLIVGAGGIGSWLAEHLFNLELHGQFPDDMVFTFADDDTVENKNLSYQNFSLEDIMDEKSESLSARYGFNSITNRIEKEEQLMNYDGIVCCVDNSKFRKLLFKYVDKYDNIFWMDMRSEGRDIAIFTKSKKNTLDVMMKTLPKEDVENGSCQRQWEFENNIIQLGNRIVSSIGAQFILNWVRGDKNTHNYIAHF
jgi:molybdopterin/thiamine biosynthesis adenylyltransferase